MSGRAGAAARSGLARKSAFSFRAIPKQLEIFVLFRLKMLSLERFPITWNHVIDKESPKFKELEHVLVEKVEQLFRDML
jgi:hypothetical protein